MSNSKDPGCATTEVAGLLCRPGVAAAAALTAVMVWYVLGCIEVATLQESGSGRLHLVGGVWRPQWPPGSFLLLVGSVLISWVRRVWRPQNVPHHRRRLVELSGLIMVLAATRVLALLDSVAAVFPHAVLLWSPHATWALAIASGVWVHRCAPDRRTPNWHPMRWFLAVFVVSCLVYGLWTLYYCQVTMLHGDEGRYLRVTQSLLHDGDMDLTNNLDSDQAREFHVVDFVTPRALASPMGRYYSQHPVGLSALLVPAYWAGLSAWGNPRLATALFMVLLASACLSMLMLWLARSGVDLDSALIVTAIIGVTAPFALYCNQIYPDVPVLLLSLTVLVVLGVGPREGLEVQLGRAWGPVLALAVVALGCALFMHPRYGPLAGVLSVPILLQIHSAENWRIGLAWVGLAATACLIAIAWYNLSYSGDLWGPFLPGNAISAGALDVRTWPVSLPGQWLDGAIGLINNSPVFVLAPMGLTYLALTRDRRVWLLLAIYAATAMVNGLHPNWTFGFCYPGRFAIGALPALAVGLAVSLSHLSRRAAGLFLVSMLVLVGLDGTRAVLSLPESGYQGSHLPLRQIAHYYPLGMHFLSGKGPNTWTSIGLWAVVMVSLAIAVWPIRRLSIKIRRIALIAALVMPAAWFHLPGADQRIAAHLSPVVPETWLDGSVGPLPVRTQVLLQEIPHDQGTGEWDGGLLRAEQVKHGIGRLVSYKLGARGPGQYTAELGNTRLSEAGGQIQGSLLVTSRQAVRPVSPCEDRYRLPLRVGSDGDSYRLCTKQDRPAMMHLFLDYGGRGNVSVGQIRMERGPYMLRRNPILAADWVASATEATGSGLPAFLQVEGLMSGMYRAQLRFEGATLGELLRRDPEPVVIAAFVNLPSAPLGEGELTQLATTWATVGYDDSWSHPRIPMPDVERVVESWWMAIPSLGRQAYELTFDLPTEADVAILAKYAGDCRVRLESMQVHRLLQP